MAIFKRVQKATTTTTTTTRTTTTTTTTTTATTTTTTATPKHLPPDATFEKKRPLLKGAYRFHLGTCGLGEFGVSHVGLEGGAFSKKPPVGEVGGAGAQGPVKF